MAAEWMKAIAAYFDAGAAAYGQNIEPAFDPLAQSLVEYASPGINDRVLDLGTGTGLAGAHAAVSGASVVGIDLSPAMLRLAAKRLPEHCVLGDNHSLPFADGSFDLILAAFAYNSTDPRIALAESLRVLRHGGRVMLQEWDQTDELGELVNETFADYTVDEPPDDLAAFREQMEQPIPWDELDSIDDLVALMGEVGFQHVEMVRATIPVRLSLQAFISYKLAWPIRAAELAAMDQEMRRLCLDDLRENLTPHADQQGWIVWMPNVVRITGYRS